MAFNEKCLLSKRLNKYKIYNIKLDLKKNLFIFFLIKK